MRSGWPTEDGRGMPPANQGQVPFGPEVSWPNAYSSLEYVNGDYRYAASQQPQLPTAGQSGHPYTAFDGGGYGDDGYNNPGYQGPVAQDAGIAGTRTVQGYVDGNGGGYPPAGYAQSSYLPSAPSAPHRQQGYAGSSYAAGEIEMAYPASADRNSGAYQQPWDYEQPLRYDDEEVSYRDYGRNEQAPSGQGYNGQGYNPSPYNSSSYNGSEYSMPGVNGPGYDLSGIINTNDFASIGYDEPSYGRLSYDDPRYDDAPRNPNPPMSGPQPVQRYNQRFDETSLDNLWQPGDDVRRENGPSGYGRPALPGPPMGGGRPFSDTTGRSEISGQSGRGARSTETRFDMKALQESGPKTRFDMRALPETGPKTRFDMKALPAVEDHTRFDVPKFDETRLDNKKASGTVQGLRVSGGVALAPSWADETSLDQYGRLDLRDEPVPSAFNRPDSRSMELPTGLDDETNARRGGKRRGRNSDRRQWMALGAIAIVAAGAIGGVLVKHVFPSGGPSHTIAAPATLDGFTQSASLEKQSNVASEAQTFAQASGGNASGLQSAVYLKGSLSTTSSATGGGGSTAQEFIFVGGKLAGSNPAASITNFEQTYPGTQIVTPGALGGEEACTTTTTGGDSEAMCVWFDNDTFGALLSPSMTAAKLATTMNELRPGLELNG